VNSLEFRRGSARLNITVGSTGHVGASLFVGKKAFQAAFIGSQPISECRIEHSRPESDDNACLWIGRSALDLRAREVPKVLELLKPFGLVEQVRPIDRESIVAAMDALDDDPSIEDPDPPRPGEYGPESHYADRTNPHGYPCGSPQATGEADDADRGDLEGCGGDAILDRMVP
jgi:hypothetical protein